MDRTRKAEASLVRMGDALRWQARAELLSGSIVQAKETLSVLTVLWPSDPEVWRLMAAVLSVQQGHEQAEFCRRASKMMEKNSGA